MDLCRVLLWLLLLTLWSLRHSVPTRIHSITLSSNAKLGVQILPSVTRRLKGQPKSRTSNVFGNFIYNICDRKERRGYKSGGVSSLTFTVLCVGIFTSPQSIFILDNGRDLFYNERVSLVVANVGGTQVGVSSKH